MIDCKDLSLDQLAIIVAMSHFDCGGIDCEDCPLFNPEHGCGSQRAGNIIDRYEKETKQ